MKRLIFISTFLVVAFSGCINNNKRNNHEFHDKFDIKYPAFSNKQFVITEYGAVSDGLTLNNEAFAKAIDACNKAGGGTVIVPKGMWLVSSIIMKSNVNLHLNKGALILYSSDYDDYELISTYYEGKQEDRVRPLIYCYELENIAITGDGIIEGTGQIWRQVKKAKTTESQWKELISSGGVVEKDGEGWWPTAEAYEASLKPDYFRSDTLSIKEKEKYKVFFRPQLLQIVNCETVLLEGVTFQNSPAWCIHPLMTKHLTVKDINVRNPWYAQNGDGIDVESCQYVNIINSRFDVGDDGICMKSGRDAEGRKRGIPTAYVFIDNCVVYHGHGGFVIGSEMSGGVNNIWVNNCTFLGTDVGLRFKSTRGRGGVVENIFIKDIRMVNIVRDAIIFDLYYNNRGPADFIKANLTPEEEVIPQVSEETPEFRNICFENIYCNGALRAIQINGLPEMPLKNLSFKNIIIKAEEGVSILNNINSSFDNIKVIVKNIPAVQIINSGKLSITNFETNLQDKWIEIKGFRTDTIQISGKEINIKEKVLIDNNINKEKVIIK